MFIKDFQIHNFKSFRSSGPVNQNVGFNIFIGKNNGGKTALLQALSPSTLVDKPHRFSGIRKGQPLLPSRVELTVTLGPGDLREAFLAGNSFFPVPLNASGDDGLALFNRFLQSPRSFHFEVLAGPRFGSSSYPSHGMFEGQRSNLTAEIVPNDQRTGFQVVMHQNNNDTVVEVVGRFVTQSVYSFGAQRRSPALCMFGHNRILSPGAENLPDQSGVNPPKHAFSEMPLLLASGKLIVGRQLADPVISAEARVTLISANLWAFVLRTPDIASWL